MAGSLHLWRRFSWNHFIVASLSNKMSQARGRDPVVFQLFSVHLDLEDGCTFPKNSRIFAEKNEHVQVGFLHRVFSPGRVSQGTMETEGTHRDAYIIFIGSLGGNCGSRHPSCCFVRFQKPLPKREAT